MKRLLLLVIIVTGAAMCVGQQNSMTYEQALQQVKNSKIIYIDGKPDSLNRIAIEDSLAREMLNFYYGQFRHYDDPAAPYFQFMSRDANLTMGIGGVVRMRGWFGFSDAITIPAFSPYLIPMGSDPTARRDFGTTPAGTSLFFSVLGSNRILGKYQLYIEANFNGYKARDFHLKKAYAQFRDLTVGLAPSTFSDPTAQAPMVDANGAANKIAPSNVLVRYMPVINKHWVLAVSVEDPDSPATYAVDTATCSKVRKWLPDVAAFVQYQWGMGEHVRLAGLYRAMTYRDRLAESNHTLSGWGLMVSGVVKPHPQLTGYFTGVYGHGYTSVMNDMMQGNYDVVAEPGRPGRMYSPAAYGWNLGVQWNFRPNLFVSAQMGQVRYLPRHAVAPDEYRFGQLAAVNLYWNPTPRSQVALEYDWGRRRNQSGATGHSNRIGAMVQFSF